jgi:hypothetical protein
MIQSLRLNVVALLFGSSVALSQFPSYELGLSTGAILSTGKNDIYLLGLLRPGFFFTQSFEVEAELGVFGLFGGHATMYGAGNLQLHLPTSANVWPFLLAGYGLTKSVNGHTYQAIVGVVNLGAGIKFVINKVAALRIEYRFQHFSGGEAHVEGVPFYSYSMVPAVDLQFHSLVVGGSALL